MRFPALCATCIYFELWLVHCIVCVLCDWLERLLLVLRHSIKNRSIPFKSSSQRINLRCTVSRLMLVLWFLQYDQANYLNMIGWEQANLSLIKCKLIRSRLWFSHSVNERNVGWLNISTTCDIWQFLRISLHEIPGEHSSKAGNARRKIWIKETYIWAWLLKDTN